MDRIEIDVTLETYTKLISIKEVNDIDTLEEVIAMLVYHFCYAE